jgi:elongin-A
MLIFEDGEVWKNLIQKEYPQEMSEKFTTNKSKIRNFYELQLNEFKFDYSRLDLEHYINLSEPETNMPVRRYRLPSKLIYLKLEREYQAKKELAIENLRQRMQEIERSKEKNKVIHLNEVIPVDTHSVRRPQPSSSLQHRSKLFQKSHGEAKKHLDYFRNPMNVDQRVIHSPQITSSPVRSVPSAVTSSPTRTFSPIAAANPVPRPRPPKQVSIFHIKKRPPPKRKRTPEINPSQNNLPTTDNSSISPALPSPQAEVPTRKRVKLGDYLSRNAK